MTTQASKQASKTKTGVVPSRPRLWFRQSRSGKRLFIRLLDKDNRTLQALNRLLVEHDVDIEAAKATFGEIGAMEVPGYLMPTLAKHYQLIQLTLDDWLSPEEEA